MTYAGSEGGFELGQGATSGIEAEHLVRRRRWRRHPILISAAAVSLPVSALGSPRSRTVMMGYIASVSRPGQPWWRRQTARSAPRRSAVARGTVHRDRTPCGSHERGSESGWLWIDPLPTPQVLRRLQISNIYIYIYISTHYKLWYHIIYLIIILSNDFDMCGNDTYYGTSIPIVSATNYNMKTIIKCYSFIYAKADAFFRRHPLTIFCGYVRTIATLCGGCPQDVVGSTCRLIGSLRGPLAGPVAYYELVRKYCSCI